MEDKENILPAGEDEAKQLPKSQWQQTKENWYDKIDLTVRQLDIIIGLGIGGLILTAIAIALDAMGVF